MRFNNLLLTGLVAIVAGASGCKTPQFSNGLVVYQAGLETYFEKEIDKFKSEGILPIPSIITYDRLVFDDILDSVSKIKYKAEPFLQDNIQTPEETIRLGTGDCDDFAMYFSKLCSDRRIKNEFVLGRVYRNDGFRLHCWNRVFLYGKKFLVDPTTNLRLLESEVPNEIYHEYHSFTPDGYTPADMKRYEKQIIPSKILPFLRDNITGDPNKKIFGGKVR